MKKYFILTKILAAARCPFVTIIKSLINYQSQHIVNRSESVDWSFEELKN